MQRRPEFVPEKPQNRFQRQTVERVQSTLRPRAVGFEEAPQQTTQSAEALDGSIYTQHILMWGMDDWDDDAALWG